MRTKLALLNIEMLIFATLIHKPWCAITRCTISSILNSTMIYDLPIETVPHTIPQFRFIIVELIYNCTLRTTLAIVRNPSSHHPCGLISSHMEIPSHLLQFLSWPRILLAQDILGLVVLSNIMAQDILGLVWFWVIKGDSLGNSPPADQHQLMDQ